MKPEFSEITECRALTRCNINYVLLPLKYLRAFPPVAFRTHKSSKKFLCCNFLQTGGFSLNYKQFHFPFEYLSNRTRTYCCSLIYIYIYIYINIMRGKKDITTFIIHNIYSALLQRIEHCSTQKSTCRLPIYIYIYIFKE